MARRSAIVVEVLNDRNIERMIEHVSYRRISAALRLALLLLKLNTKSNKALEWASFRPTNASARP